MHVPGGITLISNILAGIRAIPTQRFVVLLLGCIITPIFAQQAASTEPDSTSANHMAPISRPAARKSALRAQKLPEKFGTNIPAGILYGSFTKDDGPFLVEGSIIVPAGQKLSFGPGCEIYIGGEYSTITIFGEFAARGTAKEPVAFRSAARVPHPWDWDRIYCRSRNRAMLEHCTIEHSNYGVFVENGSATITSCTFQNNSLHAVVVRNGDVSLYETRIEKGHILGMFCREGSVVRAESLLVKDNVSGIACEATSSLTLTGGEIIRNTNALVVRRESAVTVVGTNITRNKVGIVSTEEIPRKLREMVYGNGAEIAVMTEDQFTALLKPPEEVKSIALPKTKSKVQTSKDFVPGFSATSAPREQSVSFMGNVRVGANYFDPVSTNDSLPQTRYPEGIQPEIQVFASGRRKNADISLLMDFYGNQWIEQPLHVRKNTFNLSMNYANQHFLAGDFYESGSQTSISGRKLTGIRYTGEFLPMGKGSNRMEFKLAAGESERPKDVGQHELDLYNDTVDTGMSLHQQITYIAGLTTKPTHNSVINIKGIISRDQVTQPLFRDVITDPQAPDPIKGQSGHIDATVYLLNDNLALRAEVDLGSHDTLDTTMIDEREKVVWYNPQVNEAVPNVLGIGTGNVSEHWRRHLAGSFGLNYLIDGYDFQATYTEIRPSYFSAGNPYLESDRRIAELQAERTWMEKLKTTLGYEYERRDASSEFNRQSRTSSPQDNHTIEFESEYLHSERFPAIGFEYTLKHEKTRKMGDYDSVFLADAAFDTVTAYDDYLDRELDQLFGLELKQRLENGIDYSVRYRFLWENELSKHPDSLEDNLNDGFQHQISGRMGLRIQRRLRNKLAFKVTTKAEERDSLRALSYKISDKVEYSIIPRKLSVALDGSYAKTTEEEYDGLQGTRVTTIRSSYAAEISGKYSLTSRLSVTAMGKYEKSYDESLGSPENYNVKVGGLSLTYLF